MAIALVVDAKKGMRAKQLQQHLGIGSYRTAWYMAHRIREAMVDVKPMTAMRGVVEIDETYIGGTAIRRFRRTQAKATRNKWCWRSVSARRQERR